MSEGPREGGYSLKLPFWIDTDGYTDRDRQMFTCGFEFAAVAWLLEHDPGHIRATIHRENESRVRMACGRFGRRCHAEPIPDHADPAGTWSYLEIEAR